MPSNPSPGTASNEPASHDQIVIALAGDVMLGRLVNESIALRGYAHPWGDILPALDRADLFFVNLECALTSAAERFEPAKPFHFRAQPGAVETLRIGRVSFAGIANNHILDSGPEGLEETIRVLDDAGIAHAGAGATLLDAQKPALLESHGKRVGVVAAADYPASWSATAGAPGLNFTRTWLGAALQCSRQIREARALGANYVVFCLHWGPNMRERPTAQFRDFAHRLIDDGVSIVWGHSAHVVQGIEFYHQGVILYDTGDFIDDYAVDTVLRNDLSALFLVTLSRAPIRGVRLLPVGIDDMRVNVATGRDRAYFVDRLRRLCAEMGTDLREETGDGFLEALPDGLDGTDG